MASKPSAIRGARIVGERYIRSKQQANPEGRMPLMDHLRELRNRVVKAALAIIIGMIIALLFSSPTIHWIMRPFCDATVNGMTGCKTLRRPAHHRPASSTRSRSASSSRSTSR